MTPKNKVFAYGDSVTLNCTARGGPDNLFSWVFNGTSVDTHVLTIEHFTISDSLTYECRVSNPAGGGTDTTQLYLEPRFVSKPADVFTRVNCTVRLTCSVEGNPIPYITWEYEGEILEIEVWNKEYRSGEPWSDTGSESRIQVYETHSSRHGLAVNSTLEIAHVAYSDYGWYRCTASAEVGEELFNISSNVTLSGKCLPYQQPFLFYLKTTCFSSLSGGKCKGDSIGSDCESQ